MLVATELFNKKASSAVEHLVKQGVFTSPPDPEEVASFLHDNQGLHKAMIGDYIGNRRNIDILNAYVGEDASPVQKCNEAGLGKVFANKDAVFVLAYSIIMLNVVLHSTKVKESMTLQPPSSMAFTIGINHRVRLSMLTLFSLAQLRTSFIQVGGGHCS
eukprot:Em0002g1916a